MSGAGIGQGEGEHLLDDDRDDRTCSERRKGERRYAKVSRRVRRLVPADVDHDGNQPRGGDRELPCEHLEERDHCAKDRRKRGDRVGVPRQVRPRPEHGQSDDQRRVSKAEGKTLIEVRHRPEERSGEGDRQADAPGGPAGTDRQHQKNCEGEPDSTREDATERPYFHWAESHGDADAVAVPVAGIMIRDEA